MKANLFSALCPALLVSLLFSLSATAQITVSESAFKGRPIFDIKTPTGTYYWSKGGAAFIAIFCKDGKNWINHADGRACEDCRGIPNFTGQFGHPKTSGATSVIVGPKSGDKILIRATKGTVWELECAVYIDHAVLTTKKMGSKYAFVYEGTPNGNFNAATDYYVIDPVGSPAVRRSYNFKSRGAPFTYVSETGLAYVGNSRVNRSLFLIEHSGDRAKDQAWQDGSATMAIIDFGRDKAGRTWTASYSGTGHVFSLGFIEDTTFSKLNAVAEKIKAQPHQAYSQSTGTNQERSVRGAALQREITQSRAGLSIPNTADYASVSIHALSGRTLFSRDWGEASKITVPFGALSSSSVIVKLSNHKETVSFLVPISVR